MGTHCSRIVCCIILCLTVTLTNSVFCFASDRNIYVNNPVTETELHADENISVGGSSDTEGAPAGEPYEGTLAGGLSEGTSAWELSEGSSEDGEPSEGDPTDGDSPDGDPSDEEPPVEEVIVPVVTKITGVPSKLTKNASAKVSFTVKVKPANGGRIVKLQQYDSSNKKWKTRAKYQSEDVKKASVKVTLAKKYRKKTTGKWRVVVPATERAEKAVSGTFKVISRNISSYGMSAKSACIYCIDSGEVLFTKKYKTRRLPASTTKLMTAVLVVESGKLGGKTTVSARAASTPWSYGRLRKGDKYRTKDLFYAAMLPSSNAAATALAETVSGSTEKFVKKMNKKAKKIGMTKTNFRNPHGLHQSGHYTTAFDLAKLTAYAFSKDEIRDAMGTRTRTITSLRYKRVWPLYSTDLLLGTTNFYGGKTGTSPEAKYCFTGVYKYKNKTYVTVSLNARSAAGRWNDTKRMHSYIRKYAETRY